MLVCAGAFAQGTISVQNDNTHVLTQSTGTAVGPASGVKVELFYQANSGGAAPAAINNTGALGNWTATQFGVFGLTPANSPTFGIFDPGIAQLAGITPGNNVWLDLVTWNNSAASLSAALATSGELVGFSTVWANGTGGAGSPATTPAGIVGPTQFTGLELQPLSTPEPATIALGGLGAAALLFFRRRK